MWCDVGDFLTFCIVQISTFEPNFKFGAVNEQTIKLLRTLSQPILKNCIKFFLFSCLILTSLKLIIVCLQLQLTVVRVVKLSVV